MGWRKFPLPTFGNRIATTRPQLAKMATMVGLAAKTLDIVDEVYRLGKYVYFLQLLQNMFSWRLNSSITFQVLIGCFRHTRLC